MGDAARKPNGQFGSGPDNKGRPHGTPNKVPVAQRLAAHDLFVDLAPIVKARIARHFQLHQTPPPDCATCRHYDTTVLEYVYGKPTQHHTVSEADYRRALEVLAAECGATPEELAQDAEELRAQIRAIK